LIKARLRRACWLDRRGFRQGRRKRGEKLPEICEKHGVKHILISYGLQKQGQLAITMGIFGLWRSIGMAWSEGEGTRYQLRLMTIKASREVGTHRPALVRCHRQERRTCV